MSRKKENKIKFLKRKSLWPKIIGMIITDIVILFSSTITCYLAMVGIFNTNILSQIEDSEKIVNYLDTNWTGTETSEVKATVSAYKDAMNTIESVFVLDKNLQVVASYGQTTADFNDIFSSVTSDQFNSGKKFLRGSVSENDSVQVNSIDVVIEDAESLKAYTGSLGDVIGFYGFDNNLERFRENYKEFITTKEWFLFKLKNDDVYVAVKSVMEINNFQKTLLGLIAVIFLLVFMSCFIIQIVRLVSFILGAVRYDAFISTDTITGGKNRDWFVSKAGKMIKRMKTPKAIVQIRMEKYRNYCTSYGVKEGENLLEEINVKINHIVQKKELSAHLEKSDFVILINYNNEEELNVRMNTILKALMSMTTNQHLSFNAGIAKVNNKSDDVNTLITCAALALKSIAGKSGEISWFNDSMKDELIWENRIENDMEKALENHEFQLYLQPKYSTRGEQLSAAEALVRWIHPELGFISPGKFIPLFETNGFILKLDDYMLRAVAQRQALWMKQGKQLVPISVNVSRAHFTKEDLAEHICSIVDEFNVPHEYIELELTESAFFDDKTVLLNTVNKLKEYGFSVSMDDFGAGYSSLNSLKELPLDVIKLDAEFFRNINDINRANLIVGDTITLAKKLGMKIVAEGIETREQVDFLANQDCDLIQGFYFAKPLPVNEFEKRAYPSV